MPRGRDRQFWLLIFIGLAAVAVRCIAINQPFIDPWSWRQSDVAAIARNYFEGGFHFAWPQIDWAGNTGGYVGTEFPILPFLAACSYKLFGIHEWIGRGQSVIAFAISLPFFYLLVRDTWDGNSSPESPGTLSCDQVATWALVFYSFAPISIVASRCFMPDIPSLSLSIIGLYGFVRWVRDNKPVWFALSAISISLAILIKAPTAIIGAPIAFVALERFKLAALRKPSLWIFGTLALVPSLAWYWHARQVAFHFYPHHFFGAGGVKLENPLWYWNVCKRVATQELTPLLCAVAIAGGVFAGTVGRVRLFHVWLGATALFILVVGYGNRHPWYQLPLVPIAAAFAGVALAVMVNRGWRVLAGVLVVVFLGLSFFYVKPFCQTPAANLRDAGLAIQRLTDPNALIVAADYGDPTIFYYAHRKGWHFAERDSIYNGHPTNNADAIADLESLRARGATHVVFYTGTFWWLDYYRDLAQHLSETATVLDATPQFTIFALKNPTPGN